MPDRSIAIPDCDPVVRERGEQRRNGGFAIIYPWSTVTANQFISRWGEGIP